MVKQNTFLGLNPNCLLLLFSVVIAVTVTKITVTVIINSILSVGYRYGTELQYHVLILKILADTDKQTIISKH